MSKTIAPLISFGANGALAKTAVYATWKGIPYVRRYTVPSNPRTNKQVAVRDVFRTLQSMWKVAPAGLRAPFEANAAGRPYTGNNKFTSANLAGIDTSSPPTDFSFFIGSPGAKGGLPPFSLILTPSSGQISAAVAAPTIPTDWSIVEAEGVAFKDQDPADPFPGSIQYQFDATSTYALVFTGLTAATDYVVSAWFKWLRPDGTFAYGTSLTDIATTP